MADLGELIVRIKADASQLEREMNKAGAATSQAGKKMEGSFGGLKDQLKSLIPALSAVAFATFARSAIDSAGHMQDMADRIGFAASTIAALEAPLGTSGSSIDEFAASVNRMNDMVGNAAKGNQEAIKAFDNLGLSVAKLKKLSPEEQFYAVASALGKITDQSKQTEAGMNIFGKAFSAMLPMLKEYEGNMKAAVVANKDLSNSLASDKIKRIDDFGDSLQKAGIKAKNAFLEAFAEILKVTDTAGDFLGKYGVGDSVAKGGSLNRGGNSMSSLSSADLAAIAKARAEGTLPKFKDYGEQFGPPPSSGDARGGNAGLLAPDAAQEYLAKLKQQNALLQLSDRDAAGASAEYDLKNLAAKDKTVKVNDQLIAQARALAVANYDAAHKIIPPDPDNSDFQKYLNTLQDETEALGQSEKQLAVTKALTEAKAAAQKDYAESLRDTSQLYDEEKAKITDLAGRQYELTDALEKNKHAAEEMRDALTDGLTDAILHFGSATKSARAFGESIAEAIIKSQITAPLSKGITDSLSSEGKKGIFSGVGDFLGGFFADGGDPPVGVPSVVGEEGPELFVPRAAGTIYPNGSFGGGVTINHRWNISPGIQGTVRAELMNSIPGIVAASKNAVFEAMNKGGSESRLIGRRG